MAWIYNTLASILGSISSIWNSIGSLASQIGNVVNTIAGAASAAANYLISRAIETIKAWVSAIFATMSEVYRYVAERAPTIVGWAVAQATSMINGLVEGVKQWVSANFPFVNQVIGWINDRIAQVKGFVETWVMPFINALRGDFTGLEKLVNQIMTDIMKGDIGNIAKALLPILNNILLWFKDPLRAMRDLILPLLITWVCNALAHEINPSIPLYGALSGPGGGSGGGEIGGTSPGMTGELAWPLDWLTISGNTFGVPPGHVGIDLALPAGKKVYAMHDGTLDIPNEMPAGYGVYCTVSGGKWRTLYGHNERIIVPNGVSVKKGQQISIGDTTGRSTGDHLHLEIIYNGQYIDPIDVLPIPEG